METRNVSFVFMSDDLRLTHDADSRRVAARLFEMGYGYGPVASMISLPQEAVRKWPYTFRAVGLEGLLNMGRTQAKYSWELKCAAARAVVEGEMTVVEAMAAYGVASRSPLNRWCKLYREGGADALRQQKCPTCLQSLPLGLNKSRCSPTRRAKPKPIRETL